MTSETTPIWFITGCSSGFGHELARRVLANGWRAVITARDKARLTDLIDISEGRAIALDLDVNSASQITAAVKKAEHHFGSIDVLVNNAGYGYQSSVEEGDDAEIRAQFEANVFGLFALTREILPGMRARRRGHVINITSVAGLVGFPGSGYYAASKHAVEGWSDALAAECGPLGIKVTCVEPGPFRTDWAGRSLKQTPTQIADYADTVGKRMRNTAQGSGKQPGDPARAAQAMIQITEIPNPPRHLVLGEFGIEKVVTELKAKLEEIAAWSELSLATDFPAEQK
jgi:NAD(P)-dependent dehydrogenase (short-subunit alcohol dehydrogenase family)